MTWLERLFDDIGDFFYWELWGFFRDLRRECYDSWYIPDVVGDIFNDIAWLCDDIGEVFYDIRDALGGWWDEITDLWDEVIDLYWYAHLTLTGLIDDAESLATDAWYYALEALELAQDALTEIPGWVLDQLDAAYSYALEALATVENFIADITQTIAGYVAAWWESTRLTVLDWIEAAKATLQGWIEDTQTLVLGWIEDLKVTVLGWIEDAKAAVLATIAAPINLVNLWFDDIQDFFNDPLGWLLDRFGDWFFGTEK